MKKILLVCNAGMSTNIVLLGPQIRYELENVKKLAGSVPVEAIDMRDYGMMNGEKVLKHAMEVMG